MYRKTNGAEVLEIKRNDLLIPPVLLWLTREVIKSFLISVVTYMYRKGHTLSKYRVGFFQGTHHGPTTYVSCRGPTSDAVATGHIRALSTYNALSYENW